MAPPPDERPRLRLGGDTLLLVEFAPEISPLVNRRVTDLARRVARKEVTGVRDVVPTFRSVAVHFDPLRTDITSLVATVERLVDHLSDTDPDEVPVVEIPVRYGDAGGPDLDEVAAFAGCTPEEVVRRHAAPLYRVYMMGFVPGFAYLGIVDERLRAPRRATPRTRVPAGSVAIAGPQTGIYPIDSPGGWNLVGRTEVSLFDLARSEPFLLSPGAKVRFVPERSQA
jgi:KipI family sensor histidine kinase inhibitor